MFASKLDESFLSRFKNSSPPWGPIGYVTYARTYARRVDDRIERPWETVRRCVEAIGARGAFIKAELELLYEYWFSLKCCGAGRHWWQLGTQAVERIGADSLQNCWFVAVDSLEAFTFAFNELMLGGGVGFSVQGRHIHKLPPVLSKPQIKHVQSFDCDFIVPDNREGWVELLWRVLERFFTANSTDFSYTTRCLRARGEPIKTFGGVASGGTALVEGIERVCAILRQWHGSSLDVLDVMNCIASVVVAGNVRRSSQIAIGDGHDGSFIMAKRWDKTHVPIWRAQSNNSIECSQIGRLPESFWQEFNGEGEPVGLVNLANLRRFGRLEDGADEAHDPSVEGVNPCQPSMATLLTPDGIKTFGDVGVGSLIWSGQHWTTIIAKQSSGIKPVFRWHTRAGTFIGTREHKVFSAGIKVQVGDAMSIDQADNANLCRTDPIIAIEELEEMEVFDITVAAKEHSYWTGGLLASNCGEIGLANYESCNLGEIFLSNVTDAEFGQAAELMVKVCKTISTIPHAHPRTRAVVEQNHRLGIGVTGFMQALDKHRPQLFDAVYRRMREVDVQYSKLLKVAPSVKLTTVKPSGTLAQLAGCTSGVHPAFGEYYIRRVTFASDDQLVLACRQHGFHAEPKLNLDGTRDFRSTVVEFPCATPKGTMFESEMSAIEQLEAQRWLQTWWADNCVSCTIKYDANELPMIEAWLREHYDSTVKSISFLLRGDYAGFKQMPFEEIDEDEWRATAREPMTEEINVEGTMDDGGCGSACPVR